MDISAVTSSIVDEVNNSREKLALPALLVADDPLTFQNVGSAQLQFEVDVSDESEKNLLAAITAAISDDGDSTKKSTLLNSLATHIAVQVAETASSDEPAATAATTAAADDPAPSAPNDEGAPAPTEGQPESESQPESQPDSATAPEAAAADTDTGNTGNGAPVKKLVATVCLYNYYIDLDPMGPMIEGDVVIQGASANAEYGPSFAVVSCMTPGTGEEAEIAVVKPWNMILSPPETGDADEAAASASASRFVIPVSVAEEHRSGVIRVLVYVDKLSNIPYEEEIADFDTSAEKRATLALALDITTGVSQSIPETGTGGDNGDNTVVTSAAAAGDATEQETAAAAETVGTAEDLEPTIQHFVKDIKIASDYDDVMTLQQEGYELICTHVTPQGPQSDNAQMWKFHVLASYMNPEEDDVGLEDVQWVKCLRSLGSLPVIPLFQIMHDYDLSDEGDDYSIYIAYKCGPNPRFQRVNMVSTAFEDETLLNNYVSNYNSVYRAAPTEIVKAFGGPCGLLLMNDLQPKPGSSGEGDGSGTAASTAAAGDGADGPDLAASSYGTPPHSRQSAGVGESAFGGESNEGDGSRMKGSAGISGEGSSDLDNDSDDDDDDDDDDTHEDDEDELMGNLLDQIEELQSEKASLSTLNAELQKKAVALMLREKTIQGQSAAARTAAEIASAAEPGTEMQVEQNQEREKQYQDTLVLIVDERNKLAKQLKEFDQLALDLQTRLDDKELKANGIASSFKQFKKEILSKAENSRTGHLISKKQIKQFELAEVKHEEDLERVRLRNISLRTTYRKLERTLRAREQLAEGLHMIDFEQLKIENQTLNEKIEERNEELAKLKRKKTTTVQVLTHVREKLRFVEQANEAQAHTLANLESDISVLRSHVTLQKLDRDGLRTENKDLRSKQGFATSDLLLTDFEHRCNKVEELRAAIAELQERYAMLSNQVTVANRSLTSAPWLGMSESR